MSSTVNRFAVTVLLAAGLTGIASAQTAFRCDNNGKTVYSDAPCPAGKAVVGTQETPEQKAATKEANAQMRKDNADLNKRLSDREKLEAQERAAARKAAGKPVAATAKANGKGKLAKARAVKNPKAAKQPRNKKKSKNDSTVSAAK